MYFQSLEQFTVFGKLMNMVFFTFSWWVLVSMLLILIIISCGIYNINLIKMLNGIFDLFVLQLDFRAQICIVFFSVFNLSDC